MCLVLAMNNMNTFKYQYKQLSIEHGLLMLIFGDASTEYKNCK